MIAAVVLGLVCIGYGRTVDNPYELFLGLFCLGLAFLMLVEREAENYRRVRRATYELDRDQTQGHVERKTAA